MIKDKNTLWRPALNAIIGLSVSFPASAADVNATLIRTINTAAFNPPSPDPSGIAYVSSSNKLVICDGEVDEMNIYAGANLFEMSLTGDLQATSNTLAFSREPVGCAYNPENGHFYISSDDQKRVFDIDPGSDGKLFTSDDTRTSLSTSSLCGSSDPEGLAYSNGELWVIDGVNAEVYKITPGTDELFNGENENCTHFDASSLGLNDPEGGEIDPDHPGILYVVGSPVNTVFQLTTSGTLTRTIGIAAANPRKTAGLAAVPKSVTGRSTGDLYIADRRVDNNSNPNENDGKVYQFKLPGSPADTNQAPTVNAGPDQVVNLPAPASLDGTVNDDGLPNPPAAVSAAWSQASGPGTVAFDNAAAVDTTASFSAPGTYELRLTANDTQLSASDTVTVNALQTPSDFQTIHVSTLGDGTAGGVAFKDEDIIAFDTGTGAWSLFFDGSDVGLNASNAGDVDAFFIRSDGSILLSFSGDNLTLGNLTDIDDEDIVRFVPTSLGKTTAGSFEMYFDGSDVGLTTSDEDIDALAFRSDGALIISTTGSYSVLDASGGDEDLLAFTATSLGATTQGTWALYFDGSDVGLNTSSSEDINGADIDSAGNIYLTTLGAFSVNGLSGDGNDIFRCVPGSTGSTTHCNSFAPIFNGNGLPAGAVVDGMQLSNEP